MDSDDYFSETALEELYKIAEDTDAEVIHSEKYFAFEDSTDEISTGTFQRTNFVSAPTFETEDIGERIKKFTDVARAFGYI